MLDTERLRHAFSELTDEIDPFLRPPGVGAVRATARRRRHRRMAGAATALVVVAGAVALLQLPRTEQPITDLATGPTAPASTAAPTVEPAPAPIVPASAAPPPTGQPTANAPATSSAEHHPGRGATATATLPARPPMVDQQPCTSRVTATADGANLVIAGAPVCPDATIAVFWATYETQKDGSQRLFASQRHTLTPSAPRVTSTLRESTVCVGPWYVVTGTATIRATIPVDEIDPYPSGVVASEDGEICLS